MLPLNLHHLYYFWIVAREGSVTRACSRLFLSQSTISGQIIQLERFFGLPLFERRDRRLQLTPAGQTVFRHASDIFSETEILMDTVRRGLEKTPQPLRFGIEAQISRGVVAVLVRQLRTQFRDIPVQVQAGGFRDIRRKLAVREVDLILADQVDPADPQEPLLRREIGRLELYWSAAPGVARRVRRFPEDLAKIPLVLPAPQSVLASSVQQCLARWGLEPQAAIQLSDLELMTAVAREGLGVAPLHHLTAGADWKSGRLVRLHPRPVGISKSFWLISRKTPRQHEAVTWLMGHARL